MNGAAKPRKMLDFARAFNAPTVAILVNGGAIAADESFCKVCATDGNSS